MDMVKRRVSLTKRATSSPAADMSAAPPDMVKRVSKAQFALSQVGLADIDAEVVVLLDHSGSMYGDYANGTVQLLTDRALAFGLQVDADGRVPLIPFDSDVKPEIEVRIDNYQGIVDREIGTHDMGSTNMTAALEVVKQMAADATKPIFLIVICDGSPDSRSSTTQVVCELSSYPVFIKFLAVRPVDYLTELDDLPSGRGGLFGRRSGRLLDNVDTKFIPDVQSMPDLAFFSAMADEWSTWISDATSAGVLS